MFAALAVDAVFANRGKAANYFPPGGSMPTPCTVIRDSSDRQLATQLGRPTMRGETIKVRKSEVANPVKGGQFVCEDGTFKILSDPETKDSERLVWEFTAG